MARKDETIKKDVVDQLYWDSRVKADDITIDVENGMVTLKGTVPTRGARSAAVTDTWMVSGVRSVDDQLAVKFATEVEVPSDPDIEENIQNSLYWNPDLDAGDITVNVTGGVAELTGTVEAYWQKWKAVQLAFDVNGVIDVEDKLAVVPTGSFVDEDIAESIRDALDRNLYIDAEDVTVEVERGEVKLTGVVPSNFAREKAENIAFFTSGVIEVNNNLVLGTPA